MIEQGLFKRHFVGRDGFIWWIGQVVSEEKWSGNLPGYRTPTTEDHRGFAERYKVRIMGYHTANKKELTDEQLPWASVMYPVTSGSGGAGTWSNAALRQGSFVFGFFIDGEDAQQPVIMGVIGFNEYTSLSKRDNDDVAFFPFSGFTVNDTIPRYSLTTTKEDPKGTQVDSNQPASNNGVQESVAGHEKKDGASKEQYENGKKKNPVAQPSTCEAVPLGAIQKQIQNLIADIERIKKTASDWETKVSTKINNIESEISKAVSKASEFIAGGMKWLIEEVQKYTINKINNAMKDTYYFLFPNQRPGLKKAVETANDLIACLFRKIVGNLLKMVGNFLLSAVDRFINTPLCAVENFVGSLVGNLAGLITSTVDAILGPIKTIVGAAFDLAGGILNFITDLLSFLSCEEQPSCAEIKEWSIWDGAESVPTLDLNSIISKVESVASTVTQAIDPNNFDFDLDFADVFDSLGSCNVGPVFCGPPTVDFFGGGGSGASANVIVSSVGDILGVDIITPGSGYTSEPFVKFVDNCGTGSGATARSIINNGQVVDVVIDNPGISYLSSPNGNQGGDGRTWATVEQTTVKRSDETYDDPYNPGDVFEVNPGDEVYFNGNRTTIKEPQTITAAVLPDGDTVKGPEPTVNTGQYPVILEIGRVVISDRGLGYNPGDEIVINPSNGAVLSPEFDGLGSLTKVNVVKPGQGFTEFPEIYIESDTGYNAKITPVFNVRRVDEEQIQVPQDQIISVVDCVGKF
jgi:archaellum component FlaC